MPIKNCLVNIYLRKIKGFVLPRDLIRYAITLHGDKIAVIDGERTISYGELYERAKKLSTALLNLGLGKGDTLGVLLYNSQEYFEIRIAAYLTGIVLVPIVWDMALEDMICILNDCKVKALIYHAEILGANIERLKKETKVERFIEIALPLTSKMSMARNGMEYNDILSRGEPLEPRIKLQETDLASINFSSGTTGRPKGIMLSQKSWMNSFYNYLLIAYKKRDKEITMLHMLSFATGGSTTFLLGLCAGVKNIVLQKFDVEQSISAILKYNVNTVFLSPSLLTSVLDYCKHNSIKLPLTDIIFGTEPMAPERFKEAIEFFGPILRTGYGMAEVLPPLSVLHAGNYMKGGKRQEEILLSAGRPLGGVTIRIVDNNNREIPSGKTGKIAVKSSTISCGYWNNPELNHRCYKDGWFYTSDYGYLDKKGYLYILGRKEDILKENKGEFIFARQIEDVLHQHGAVSGAYVFSASKGQICACVSLKRNSPTVVPEEIIRFCKDNLGKDIIPAVVTIYSELPKNASGKLDRKRIREEFLKTNKI